MSLKTSFLKHAWIFLFGIIGGVGYFAYESMILQKNNLNLGGYSSKIDIETPIAKYNPASQKLAKAERHIAKANGLFSVEIHPTQNNVDDGDLLELTGTIVPRREISRAEIKWVLFKGFVLADGSQTLVVEDLQAHVSYDFKITVRKTTQAEGVIHLSVDTKNEDGVIIGSSSSFSTHQLDSAANEKAAAKVEVLTPPRKKIRFFQ